MEDLKKLKVKNWKEIAKDRRTWRDLAEKAKTHKGLQCQMMMTMIKCLCRMPKRQHTSDHWELQHNVGTESKYEPEVGKKSLREETNNNTL